MGIIKPLLLYPKLLIGAFLTVIFVLLFFFSTLFKLGIMFIALYFIYKMFPPNYRKVSNFGAGVILTAGFIVLVFVGKGTGFLSVGNVPNAVKPAVEQANTSPIILALFFIIAVLAILYLHKRGKK